MIGATDELLTQLLGPFGLLVFLLVFVVYGAQKKWWVTGREHSACERDRDFYREISVRLIEAGEKAATVSHQLLEENHGRS